MIPITNQWELTGKCEECRKQPYCGSQCKKHKQRLKAELVLGVQAEAGKEKPFIFANDNVFFEKVSDGIQEQKEKEALLNPLD